MTTMRLLDRARVEMSELLASAFTISGELLNARAGAAYSCRIPFYGNVGNVIVQSWSGDMPPGTTLWIDNTLGQLVVEYPAYQAGDVSSPVPIPNADFASGDGWLLGEGWQISGGVAFFLARGESLLISAVQAPCEPGTSITASVDVAQGASKAGNCGAAVQLLWYDANRRVIDFDEGNMVMSSDDPPFTSTVSAVAPAGTVYAGVAVHGFRRRENKEMHVDNVQWSHYVTVGGLNESTFCLAATLRDEAGREAVFSDCMNVAMTPTLAYHDKFYKNDGDVFTFTGYVPNDQIGNRAATNGGNGSSANGLAFWYNRDAGDSTDHICRYDTDTGQFVEVPRDPPNIGAGVGKFLRFSPDGSLAIAAPCSTTDLFDLFRWNGTKYEVVSSSWFDVSSAIQLTGFHWSPDGTRFATLDLDSWLRVWTFDTETGAMAGPVWSVFVGNSGSALDWRGNYIAAGDYNLAASRTRVYNATTGAHVATLNMPYEPLGLHFSHDLRYLYACRAGSSGALPSRVETYEFNAGAGTLTLLPGGFDLPWSADKFELLADGEHIACSTSGGAPGKAWFIWRLDGATYVDLGECLPGTSPTQAGYTTAI